MHMEMVALMLYDGDDGFGAMSFDHDGDDMVMSIACLIEDPLPLSSPFIPLPYLALWHPLFPCSFIHSPHLPLCLPLLHMHTHT